MKKEYTTFAAFWPFYLHQHSNLLNRFLHFIGTMMALFFLGIAVFLKQPLFIILMPIVGYGWAWIGHFKVEKNRPATFKYPFYSILADYKLFFFMLIGKYWAQGPVIKWEPKI